MRAQARDRRRLVTAARHPLKDAERLRLQGGEGRCDFRELRTGWPPPSHAAPPPHLWWLSAMDDRDRLVAWLVGPCARATRWADVLTNCSGSSPRKNVIHQPPPFPHMGVGAWHVGGDNGCVARDRARGMGLQIQTCMRAGTKGSARSPAALLHLDRESVSSLKAAMQSDRVPQ